MQTETKILKIDDFKNCEESLLPAARTLREGNLVVFPTETVYGLGANALDSKAVNDIFKAKGRPNDNPLIVHISALAQLDWLVTGISEKAYRLINAFWPGALTLVFEKSDKIPDEVSAGLPTVAVRMPQHPVALKLISLSGVPLAAPSANVSGRPSPTSAQHVIEDLFGKVAYIIDGGNCDIGVESTVLDMTVDPPMLLRPGGVTRESIEALIGDVQIDRVLHMSADETPKSPGMKYRHYAPKAEMTLFTGEPVKIVSTINSMIEKNQAQGLKTAVLSSDETRGLYHADKVWALGAASDPEQMAYHLYAALRACDESGVDIIYAETFSESGMGLALMNRLKKAAGGRIISV